MSYGLDGATICKIRRVFQKYEAIDQALLYGSRAKGTYRPSSDIDLVLQGERMTFEMINSLRNDLDDLNLPYTFDISYLPEIENPDLLDHIKRVGILFYSKTGPMLKS